MSPGTSNSLRNDLLITFVTTIIVCWFVYQYGLVNSPDSFYRGVVAKSIIEGHPFFTNVHFGWQYDMPVWHHDSWSEPLLPAIYAVLFLVFGVNIVVTNVVSCVSAGLFIFPLLHLSRRLTGFPVVGLLLYLAVVLYPGLTYLFEVRAGLSIPTFTLLLVLLLLNIDVLLQSERKIWIWSGAATAACLYFTRSEASLLLFFVAITSLIYARVVLDSKTNRRFQKFWGISLLFVAPWILRKIILFGNPFFSQLIASFWSTGSHRFWDYREYGEYPTAWAYFERYGLWGFIEKKLIMGPARFYNRINEVFPGPAWAYILLLVFSATVIILLERDDKRRLFYWVLFAFIAGNIGLFSLAPFHSARYFIPLFLLVTFISSVALLKLCSFMPLKYSGKATMTSIVIIATASAFAQFPFWSDLDKYLRFSYTTSEQAAENDQQIIGLKRRFPDPEEVKSPLLGPWGQVQKLAFYTGLPFIEEPKNLRKLKEPLDFFQRYNIQYSLVDVSMLFKDDLVVRFKAVGGGIIYTIPWPGQSIADESRQTPPPIDEAIRASVATAVKNRFMLVYSDAGATDLPEAFLREQGITLRTAEGLTAQSFDLFESGLLVLTYHRGMQTLSEHEIHLIYKFLDNGGRLLILCPAWVWTHYDKKGLEDLPHNQILQYFNIVISAGLVEPPYAVRSPLLQISAVDDITNVVASKIIYDDHSKPLITGSKNAALAVISEKHAARVIVWGHNYPMDKEVLKSPSARETLTSVLDWLFESE